MSEKMRHILRPICNRIVETLPVKQIYLFGSYAYGHPKTDSDYDLYVVIPDEGPRPLDAMKSLQVALYKLSDRPLDILVGHESSFQSRQEGLTLERTILTRGILLYATPDGLQQAMA